MVKNIDAMDMKISKPKIEEITLTVSPSQLIFINYALSRIDEDEFSHNAIEYIMMGAGTLRFNKADIREVKRKCEEFIKHYKEVL